MRPTRFLALLLFCSVRVSAQSTCPPLQSPPLDPSKVLFTPRQEMELGEVIRQQLESDFQVIEDEQLTGYLRRVGERVALHLPDSGLHYQFIMYDRPEIQAFGMPGGRIYLSRKMAAFLHNEDELAGVLGHEMGHLAARQQAIEMSRRFREILGTKALSDSDDLFELYNQMVESIRIKKRHVSSEDDNKNQMIADQLGIQSVARAGYAPQAFSDSLDRLMQTKGKTGNWFSDLFGATRPDSRRLREALKDVSTLPASCIDAKTPSKTDEFHEWQTAALRNHGIGHAERLGIVLSRKQLKDPLRGDIENFRFSSDGKYALAQDESGIYLLTRDPLQFAFRIDAVDAHPAQFSPDGSEIVFFDSALRVETWNIAQQEQTGAVDVPATRGCRESALSPDAKFLACFDKELALALFDVATGEEIFRKEKFFDFDAGYGYGINSLLKLLYFITHPEVTTLRFSPDGHYFAAASRTKEEVVIDLTTRKKISVSGAVHTLMEYSFSFVGPDRIAGVDTFNPQKSILAEFPSGKIVDHMPLGGGAIVASTNPNFLLIRPVQDHAVGVYDLTLKKFVMINRMSALDVWKEEFLSERLNGEVGLYNLGVTDPANILQLPLGKLGGLRAFTASPDLKYVAFSSRTRGAVWNLDANARLFHMRSFRDAYFAPNVTFFLDFPEFEKVGREMAVLSPVTLQTKGRPVEKDDDITFFGNVFLRTKHNDKDKNAHKNFDLDALDMATQTPLWSRTFPKQGPSVLGTPPSGKVVFLWEAKSPGLRDELARDTNLQARWTKANPGDTDFFVQVLDARDGKSQGGVVLHTGKYSVLPERLEAVGDWLVVVDNANRVLLYSLSTGELQAKWFGFAPRLSANGERLCLANGRGHLVLYDLRTLKKSSDLYFANPIAAHVFSADGKKLLVLTNDQTAFVVDVTATAETASRER